MDKVVWYTEGVVQNAAQFNDNILTANFPMTISELSVSLWLYSGNDVTANWAVVITRQGQTVPTFLAFPGTGVGSLFEPSLDLWLAGSVHVEGTNAPGSYSWVDGNDRDYFDLQVGDKVWIIGTADDTGDFGGTVSFLYTTN